MCRACKFCAEYIEKFPDELTNEEVTHFLCNIIDIYGESWDSDDKKAVLFLVAQYLQEFNQGPVNHTH